MAGRSAYRGNAGRFTGLVVLLVLGLAAGFAPLEARGQAEGTGGPGRAESPGGAGGLRPLRDFQDLRSAREVLADRPGRLHARPAAWLLLLPGPLAVGARYLILRARRRRRGLRSGLMTLLPAAVLMAVAAGAEARPAATAILARAEAALERADAEAALEEYRQAEDHLPDSPALQVNLALLHERAGRVGPAVHHFRRALLLDPGDRQARRLLAACLERHELSAAPAPGAPLPPDLPFVVFLVLFNLAWMSALQLRSGRSGGVQARTMVLAALAVLALGGFAVSLLLEQRPLGVIGVPGAVLQRIPEPMATDRLPVAAGTAVRIDGRVPGYLLVRTGSGLRGWLREGACLLDDPPMP